MISLRTKDEVTEAAAARLFAVAATPAELAALAAPRIAELIYPAGFYRTKAASLRAVGQIIAAEYAGVTPNRLHQLVALPGVGRKTANLVLGLGFGIPAICVDTHVHRICNRLGWVATTTPEQTEKALARRLPRRYWIEINAVMVGYGQQVCTPLSPFCSRCPVAATCPRHGVGRRR